MVGIAWLARKTGERKYAARAGCPADAVLVSWLLVSSAHHKHPPACVRGHESLKPRRRCLATAYTVTDQLVYFVQLTFVAPRIAHGQIAEIDVLLFRPVDSFLYAVDLLGYSFMSVATQFAARCSLGVASIASCGCS